MLYLSINIFDRYLAIVGFWNFCENDLYSLVCVCSHIAAKVAEIKRQTLDNLIYMIEIFTGDNIESKKVIELE